jgi:iron only hydrogenase large subunit-like protein/nitrogen-specific signal transduction histidine kinase
MSHGSDVKQLVFTLRDRCRVCYTCVRECPAKAIRIANGQAEVIHERCIGCGSCTKLCSQGAKVFLWSVKPVEELIATGAKVAACIAPSFPAEFIDIQDHRILVNMIRQLGFHYVHEVAFGADLVAAKYKELFENAGERSYIAANCPAIIYYIRQFHPELVNSIAPIASPLVAMARVIRKKHGKDTHVVFIGPCIAKKSESDEVDFALTFKELREMFYERQITSAEQVPSEFDAPTGGRGALFPVSRGMLQTANISDNILHSRIAVAEGRINFQVALKEFESGHINDQHLELLACDACIMGPGMSTKGMQFSRRNDVAKYVRNKITNFDREEWEMEFETYKNIDLSQTYEVLDRRSVDPSEKQISDVLKSFGKNSIKDHLNCGACGYDTCHEHAVAIIKGLAEPEMCLPYTIEKLHQSIAELDLSNIKLVSVQKALKKSEKLANMGQLSAGIAHELNNPLGVIIMYSNLLLEDMPKDSESISDLKLIAEQADRCKKIVGGLLNFARKNQVRFEDIDLKELAEKSLTAIVIPSNIRTKVHCKTPDKYASLDFEQMMQVLTNLNKNAVDAMPNGGELTITIDGNDDEVTFLVMDSGTGISQANLEKIFVPFFTTKGIGKGTGLGLATAYGIVKMHKGKIKVSSNANPALGQTGTIFTIKLPRRNTEL